MVGCVTQDPKGLESIKLELNRFLVLGNHQAANTAGSLCWGLLGNWTKLLNHSKAPNCVIERAPWLGEVMVLLKVEKRLLPEEQLIIEYGSGYEWKVQRSSFRTQNPYWFYWCSGQVLIRDANDAEPVPKPKQKKDMKRCRPRPRYGGMWWTGGAKRIFALGWLLLHQGIQHLLAFEHLFQAAPRSSRDGRVCWDADSHWLENSITPKCSMG